MTVDDFLAHIELPERRKFVIERGKILGGKFALLARALEGDELALKELEQLINAGQVAPNRDLTTQRN